MRKNKYFYIKRRKIEVLIKRKPFRLLKRDIISITKTELR